MELRRLEDREWLIWAIQRLPNTHRMLMQFHLDQRLEPETTCRFWKIDEATLEQKVAEAMELLSPLQARDPPAEPVRVPAIGFRYLPNNGCLVSGHPDPQPCLCCGAQAPGFVVLTNEDNGTMDLRYVCDPCLRACKLESIGEKINEGDSAAAMAQIEALNPNLSPEERERLVRARTLEVEFGTPRPMVWQPFMWPAHCGDYMGFGGQVQREDVNDIAGGNGRDLFLRHIQKHDWDEPGWAESVWEEGFAPEGFHNVYLWRCLHCGQPLLTSDHE